MKQTPKHYVYQYFIVPVYLGHDVQHVWFNNIIEENEGVTSTKNNTWKVPPAGWTVRYINVKDENTLNVFIFNIPKC